MKNRRYQKLSCRRGASVLIALLVFFLAALSGTLALIMATSNAGRYTHEKEDQQAYLSVASAAKLILDRLEGIMVVVWSPTSPPQNGPIPEGMTVTIKDAETEAPLANPDMFLADKNFTDYITKYAVNGATASLTSFRFDLSVTNAPEMGTVHTVASVTGGEFSFRLWYVNGASSDYQMTLRVAARFDKNGIGNFTGNDTDGYSRWLTFDTKQAEYIVERDIEPDGSGEPGEEEGA